MSSLVRKNLFPYILLIAAVFIQIHVVRYREWCPDLMLLIVIFTAVFAGSVRGVLAALAAGFLRSIFSANELPLDVLIFPAIALLAAGSAKMFYRANLLMHIFVVVFSMLFLVILHAAYLNIAADGGISLISALRQNWRAITVTAAVAPLVFLLFGKVWGFEE